MVPLLRTPAKEYYVQHFDFETDACGVGDIGCSFCAPAGPETHALALGMTTAGVLLETGADLGGATWCSLVAASSTCSCSRAKSCSFLHMPAERFGVLEQEA